MQPHHVCVVGLGYIGLPTAAMFASRGVKVTGVDVNHRVVHTISSGRIHIVEPELDAIVHTAVSAHRLTATFAPSPADAFLIAVPTPFKDGHVPDLDYVKSAARSIAPVLKRGDIVILESTSPVGTTEQMAGWLAEERPDLCFPRHGESELVDVHIAYCPERVLPGKVVRELVQNDRVIGGLTPACAQRAADVYRVFVEGELLFTDARTAEMCKLTENASRDAAIAFANELSIICDRLGVDVWELIRLANHHPRVNIMQPAAGVGGHCIAVDPWFIVHSAPEQARLIRTAREVNNRKPKWVARRILEAVEEHNRHNGVRPVCVALLGLAFKPDIDDLRESPAVEIAREVSELCPDARLLAVEPHIAALPPQLDSIELCHWEEAVAEADIVAVLVGHRHFRAIPSEALAGKDLIDVTGIVVGLPRQTEAPLPRLVPHPERAKAALVA
jgi:UDP-N-acetyl-D-mannosaminuronic acid dehydrogenase